MNKKLIVTFVSIITVIVIAFTLFLCNGTRVEVRINGEKTLTVNTGETYTDGGAKAYLVGNIFFRNGKEIAEVTADGTADTAKLGTYTVKYSAKKLLWSANDTRTVTVVDTVAPELALKGDKKISLYVGGKYEEPGFTATDNYDGDITQTVTTEGTVDTAKVGNYTVTYTAKDSSGNTVTDTREVTVKPVPVLPSVTPSKTVTPGSKTVYLTFDDGPGSYTSKLLDILKKYNVKATFFVINSGNYSALKRMAAEGHSIGVHSATHTYKQIYASEAAYFEDFTKMQNIIKEQTGITTTLLRFPGGSSNTVSSFNKGIMTRLTRAVTEKGYTYFDWNVTSGDAGETTSTAQVIKNVKNGIASHSVSVVLQHDIKNFSVNAVEEIIKWGLANGYTFKALDATSPTCHHGINN